LLAGFDQFRAGEVRECVVEVLARTGLSGQLGGGSKGYEFAQVHEPDATAQLGGLVHVVSGEQDGRPFRRS
jgi:hypothetical protein